MQRKRIRVCQNKTGRLLLSQLAVPLGKSWCLNGHLVEYAVFATRLSTATKRDAIVSRDTFTQGVMRCWESVSFATQTC